MNEIHCNLHTQLHTQSQSPCNKLPHFMQQLPISATLDPDEQLIDEYQKHENLWNVRHPNYKDKVSMHIAWKDISNTLGASIQDCKHRMRHLRGRYSRMKHNRLRHTGHLTENSWALYWRMDFLKDVVMPRNVLKSAELLNEDNSPPAPLELLSDEEMTERTSSVPPTTATGFESDTFPVTQMQTASSCVNVKASISPDCTNNLTTHFSTAELIQAAMESLRASGSVSFGGVGLEALLTSATAQCSEMSSQPGSALVYTSEMQRAGTEEVKCSRVPVLTPHSLEDMDEDELFIRAVGKTLKRIGGRKKGLLKIKIQRLLYDAEFEDTMSPQ